MDLRQIWSFQCRPLPSLAVPGGGDRFGGDNRGDDISNGGNRHLTARELFMRRSCHGFFVWFFKNFQRMCCKKSIVFLYECSTIVIEFAVTSDNSEWFRTIRLIRDVVFLFLFPYNPRGCWKVHHSFRREKTFHERIMNGFGEQDIYNISIVYSRISIITIYYH